MEGGYCTLVRTNTNVLLNLFQIVLVGELLLHIYYYVYYVHPCSCGVL